MAGYAVITPGNHDTVDAFPFSITLAAINLDNKKRVQRSVVLNLQGTDKGEGWEVGAIRVSHAKHADVQALAG